MSAKAKIVSKQTIKPSSSTPHHLRDFKLSFLDQLSLHTYVPVVLFYSASDVSGFGTGFPSLSGKLKASLSDVLTLYYPFCGRMKGNACVECNDAGVLFFEARVPSRLSEILEDPQPQVNVLKQFLPFDPYEAGTNCNDNEEPVIIAVQASEFSCGAVGVGVCILHTIADGITMASFLNAWAATARGSGNITKPHMEAALLFPAGDLKIFMPKSFCQKDRVTRRLVFDGTNLSKLRAEMKGCNPTRVEAVTALIWKSIMQVTTASSGKQKHKGSIATHIVNFRSRMVPPLPEYSFGNLVRPTATAMVEIEVDKRVELLQDLAIEVRKAIRKVDGDLVSKLQGDGGFHMAMEFFEQIFSMATKFLHCNFSSWARFPFYEVDFGWGKPTWVCAIAAPIKNSVLFMPTRCGEGIEAWVNLTEHVMVDFERNPELLQYASLAP